MGRTPDRVVAATYRLQLSRDMGFRKARDLVGYLDALGITELYLSPVLRSRASSTHGYDVVDPAHLDPKLGEPGDFVLLAQELEARGLGLLLDIVPNHMAAVPSNPWFRDVLEKGQRSPFARFFDIDWSEEDRTLLPVLAEPFAEALEKGLLSLEIGDTGLVLRYGDRIFPLDPASYGNLLAHGGDRLEEALAPDDPLLAEWRRLLGRIEALPPHSSSEAGPGATGSRREEIKRRLLALYGSREALRDFVDANLQEFNDTADPSRLEALLEQQAYRLSFWRRSLSRLNYRRFFTVSELIGVRVEDPEVFESTHALLLRLAAEKRVTGFRVDHIDGLRDPEEYLHRLRARLEAAGAPDFFLVVEKILARGEELPPSWPVDGTTGYEFAREAGGVLCEPRGVERMRQIYAALTGETRGLAEISRAEKKRVIETRLAAELRSLAGTLRRLAEGAGLELTEGSLSRVLAEVTASLGVYRTYVRGSGPGATDRFRIDEAVERAGRSAGQAGPALEFLSRVLRLDFPEDLPASEHEAWVSFVLRWQQFTPPAMAKGVEDTAFYLYHAVLCLNEVGGDGEASSENEFHAFQLRRLGHFRGSLNATSTHDTKRSEDARARIAVLTEIPDEWAGRWQKWSAWNAGHRLVVKGREVPDAAGEALLYETLLGAWPLDGAEADGPAFRNRVDAFLVKAAREGKRHSSWIDPDLEYEAALTRFARAILEPSGEPFRGDFLEFQGRIALAGAVASLSQALLKVACPGVPDLYQGTEIWDFSLVDPDNRRPVDFARRRALLEGLDLAEREDRSALLESLREGWKDGRIKLYLLSRALRFRRSHPCLFRDGSYVALRARGRRNEHVLAFARRLDGDSVITIAPRWTTRLARVGSAFGRLDLDGARLPLPAGMPRRWHNVFTGSEVTASDAADGAELDVHDVLSEFPVALLWSRPDSPAPRRDATAKRP
jgi:(1->4)-alpha-D-glucan 1-alpha-D-glucosylmutase